MEETFISIDVGIKNLAICLFKRCGPEYEVIIWDVIDICDTESKKICQNKKCNKIAKYIKGEKYFCKTHAKYDKLRIPTKQQNIKYIKKMKMKEVQEYCNIENIDTTNCKLKQQHIDVITDYISDNFFDIIQDKNANNMTLIELGKNMLTQFDSL